MQMEDPMNLVTSVDNLRLSSPADFPPLFPEDGGETSNMDYVWESNSGLDADRMSLFRSGNEIPKFAPQLPIDSSLSNITVKEEPSEQKSHLFGQIIPSLLSGDHRAQSEAASALPRMGNPLASAITFAPEVSQPKPIRKYTRRTARNGKKADPDSFDDEDDKISKNREAAQLFRQRQRDHIKTLEQQVEQLSVQNQQFISQSDQLTTENKLIRQQLYVLREFISQAMSFAFSNIPANLLYQQLQHLSAQSVGQPAQQSLLSSSQQTSLTN